MTTVEMLAELREVLADELPDYGFSDARALAYLNEGQDKFCEDTGFFTDTSTFTVATEVGKSSYPLDARIIRVEDVFIGGRQLRKFTGFRASANALEPTLWRTDAETGVLTIWPAPTSVVTMTLHVWRYPKAELKPTTTVVNPELPKRLHRACIEWAAFKCYCHHDIELQGGIEAMKHKREYRNYVLEGRSLKRNMDSEQIVVGTNPCYQVAESNGTSYF